MYLPTRISKHITEAKNNRKQQIGFIHTLRIRMGLAIEHGGVDIRTSITVRFGPGFFFGSVGNDHFF